MPKKEAPTFNDLVKEFTAGLRRAGVRPSISGYKPQDHQIPFHQSQAKGRLMLGGNRSGKTVSGGAEMVMHMTGQHRYWQKFKPPVYCRAVGVDFDNGVKKIMMPEIARWTPPSLLKNGSWEESYSKGDKTLTLTNGSTLEFMSYDQDVDKFAGTSRHFIWFDEEPPEDIFNENMLRLVDKQGHWWLTMTPLIDMSWTEDRLYLPGKNGENPDIEVWEVMTLENKYVNEAELDILTLGMSEEEKAARQKGEFIGRGKNIYANSLDHEVNYIDPITSADKWPEYFNRWGHFGMLDHGYTNPTAFYLGVYNEDGQIIIWDEYYETKRLVHENARFINERIASFGLQDKLQYIVADPSIRNTNPITGTTIHSEYAEHGLFLSLGNNDVHAGIMRCAGRFKNKQLFVTKNCEKLIWELGRYRWDKFASSKIANRRNLKETPVKKDDHGCDAIRYGVMSRPALDGELDTTFGNVLNVPIARSDWDRDFELMEKMAQGGENQTLPDPYLGSDY